MKKFIVLLYLGFVTVFSFAQARKDTTSLYVFPSFAKGKVVLKSGDTLETWLNYQTYNKIMLFEENGEILFVAEPECKV